MGSPVQIDLDALLRPISEAQPSGPDLREDESAGADYLDLKDARRAARGAERTLANAELGGDDGIDARAIDDARVAADDAWKRILALAPRLLAERSKDLEVAAYWIEALTRERGFSGLRDGLRATRTLVETFWDDLYPRPDAEEGIAARCAPLSNLNGDGADGPLPTRISLLPLTEAIDERGGFSTWHYGQARELSKLQSGEAREERERAGACSMESFQSAVAETSDATLAETLADIEEALAEWEALSRAIADRAAGYAPPATAVREALEAARDALRFSARDRLAPAESPEEAASSDEAAPAGGEARPAGGARGGVGGPLQSREEALRALTQVAQYLRKTEPHSPISYAVEQCVRWGSMSLPELLREILSDESARSQLFQRVGIRDESSQ